MAGKKKLLFTMQPIHQTNWCWAANAASIAHFYDSGTAWTQCKIASVMMKPEACCMTPEFCNHQAGFHEALEITDNLLAPLLYDPIPLNEIKQQIDTGNVIGTRIKWTGGGGHFVSIFGYDDSGADPFVSIADPTYGTSDIKLSKFTSSYQDLGQWTHSYLTRPSHHVILKFSKTDLNLLAKAEDMKSRLGENNSFKSTERISAQPIQQEVFIISLESLKGNGEPKFIKSGVRVIKNLKKSNRLIYEFDSDGPDASIQQVINDRSYASRYFKSISAVALKQKKIKNYFDLDVIRIPQLKLEALWLHSKTDSYIDQYIPVFSATSLKDDIAYNKDDFFKILRHEARSLPEYDNPLYGG